MVINDKYLHKSYESHSVFTGNLVDFVFTNLSHLKQNKFFHMFTFYEYSL